MAGHRTLDLSATGQTLHQQVTAVFLYDLTKTGSKDRTRSASSIRFSFTSPNRFNQRQRDFFSLSLTELESVWTQLDTAAVAFRCCSHNKPQLSPTFSLKTGQIWSTTRTQCQNIWLRPAAVVPALPLRLEPSYSSIRWQERCKDENHERKATIQTRATFSGTFRIKINVGAAEIET